MQPVTTMMQSDSLGKDYFTNRAHALIDILDRFKSPDEEQDARGGNRGIRQVNSQEAMLSESLSLWARTFLQEMMKAGPLPTVEKVKELVLPHFTRLEQEVLRDPFLSAVRNSPPVPFREPVIEREWIWDRAVHKRCYVLFRGISPLDGKDMVEIPPSHAFAQAIIDWKATVFPQDSSATYSSESAVVVMRLPQERDQNVERAGYKFLALQAKMRRAEENCLRQTNHTMQVVVVRQQETQVVLAEAQARADLHEAHLAEELQSLEHKFTTHIQQLNSQIDVQEKEYRHSIEQLEQNIRAAEVSNQATAAALRVQLSKLNEEQQKTRVALEGQVHAAKQLQEQKVRELKAEQALIESTHKLQVTQMQSCHSQTVSTLQGNISTLSGRVEETKQALTSAQQVSQQQQRKICELAQQTDHLRRQVDRERQRADEADDGFCSLM